jgi:hypothetical protein
MIVFSCSHKGNPVDCGLSARKPDKQFSQGHWAHRRHGHHLLQTPITLIILTKKWGDSAAGTIKSDLVYPKIDRSS